MNIIKVACLMIFAFGIAIMSKYIGFRPWVEANCWIGLPMAAIGVVGICFLFGGRGK